MALKIDFIDSGPYRFKAQSLATEGPADDASSSAPANVAALSNPACRPSGRVSQFGQLAAIRASALAIKGGGDSLLQCLMRTVVVVVVNEAGGPLLLAARGRCWRASHFG